MLYYVCSKYNENQVGVKRMLYTVHGKSLMAEQNEAVGADVALRPNTDFYEIWVILTPDSPTIYSSIYMKFC